MLAMRAGVIGAGRVCELVGVTVQGERSGGVFAVGSGVFFFQAEDGIRDLTVTGVQTCALPISFGVITLTRLSNSVETNLIAGASRSSALVEDLKTGSSPTWANLWASRNSEIGRASCRERV